MFVEIINYTITQAQAESRKTVMGGVSNRMKEVKRRRHRRQKLAKFNMKLKKSNTSEKLAMAEKLRKMTPGCDVLIERMGLDDRKGK